MKKTTRKKQAKPAAKKVTRRAVKAKATKKPAITNKVQELIDKTASVPIEAYIVNAVTKALKKRDDAIMAELAKIEGFVRRVEEIVAVVERSEILLTKIDAVASREVVVRAGEIAAFRDLRKGIVHGCEHVGCKKPEPHAHEIGGPCAAEVEA